MMLPIPGTSSVAHVEENIASASIKIPDNFFEELSNFEAPPAVLR
jgi:aryl-alcohol dehydrogenase-like predicted oxidoreductase